VSYNATTFYDRDRHLQGVFAAARDITQSKEVEAKLQTATAAADKANHAKSDFLSSMSHELRTPLSAILGFAQLMDSATPHPTVFQKRSIGQILQAGWYLLDLINEILDLALIESGKLSLSQEPVSLGEVMQECQAITETQAGKRGVSVTFPRLAAPYWINADRTRIKQVFINLLSNAIKYNKVGGTVAVDCMAVTAGRIRISVTDTGPGLTLEKLAQLFQPFNRLGQETSTEEGTGIGLVMTKRLVELMGGNIRVESTLGQGSVFLIEMNLTAEPPCTTPPSESATGVEASPPDPGHLRLRTLLYVEDNPANLMLVEELIARRPDMRLLSAIDGARGIEIARAEQPDIILMDINLPGISGIRAMQILAEDLITAHIPVIALSANAIPRDIEKGLEAGFFRYLTKPIKVNAFMNTLDDALKLAAARYGIGD
jgi:CheY-like chemotaxis protein/nitrogen-specific signal transduction histidine kinase